jgi:hypothetical protein
MDTGDCLSSVVAPQIKGFLARLWLSQEMLTLMQLVLSWSEVW